jgi:hypothetical protein
VHQVETHFGSFGDSVNLDERQVHGLSPNVPYAQKSFWTHLIVLLGDVDQAEANFNPFRDSFNSGARMVHG